MKKFFKYVMLISFFSLAILLLNQSSVEATTIKTISTMDELKTAFEGKATIEGNTIKLTDNVILKDNPLGIEISEMILDFNGKTIELQEEATIYVYNKITLKDSSKKAAGISEWGGINFNSRAALIEVTENAELVINSGCFIDIYNGENYNEILRVNGKLKINGMPIFKANRTEKQSDWSSSMIRLLENSETTINGGSFNNLDRIIDVTSNNIYKNNCKLIINGGSFTSTDESNGTINIVSLYPYADEENNKEIITPTVMLNNCSVEGKHIAIQFTGGSTEKEYRNEDTKILTINGGTYKCSGIAAFDISTYLSPFTYFNPKDFVIRNGKFEGLIEGASAMRLEGPKKR